MGQKQSSTANWTIDEWAFGTAQNAVPIEDVIQEAKKVPAKYFGGQVIENDASMHQMQHDLLSFDATIKRLFFWRKKSIKPKKEEYADEYYYDDKQHYDQSEQYDDHNEQYDDYNQDTIFEEDQNSVPSHDVDKNQSARYENTFKSALWACGYCGAENQSTHLECRKCRQIETNF